MQMVKEGELSIEEAIAKVKAEAQEKIQVKKGGKGNFGRQGMRDYSASVRA